MRLFKALLPALGLIVCSGSIEAQQDLVMYNMSIVPQHHYVNPARAPYSRLNIGLPVISSIYLKHENTVFNPGHLLQETVEGMEFRTDHFMTHVKDENFIGAEGAIDLLSLGIAIGEQHYFSFAIRERMQGRLVLPGDMIRFPFTGNASFDELKDNTVDFSGFRIQLNHFREYGVGWQYDFSEKWNFGARLKLLYGMENIDTKESSLKWETDPTTWDWNFTGEMDVYSSGIWELTDSLDDNTDIENGEIAQYLLKRKNKGLGIDLGAEYQVNDKLSVSASLTDLGFISWKTYNRHATTSEGAFAFTGLELTEQVLNADSTYSDTLDVIIEDLLDELEQNFAFKEEAQAYRTALFARLHLGANYKLYENDKTSGTAGLLLQSEFFKGSMRPTA
ncbi:MAG: hypothetical protein HKN32_07335, partial [Flavobacteriales bacterium]|nr:hypothetical protein [Flavobacteriales bacterium]